MSRSLINRVMQNIPLLLFFINGGCIVVANQEEITDSRLEEHMSQLAPKEQSIFSSFSKRGWIFLTGLVASIYGGYYYYEKWALLIQSEQSVELLKVNSISGNTSFIKSDHSAESSLDSSLLIMPSFFSSSETKSETKISKKKLKETFLSYEKAIEKRNKEELLKEGRALSRLIYDWAKQQEKAISLDTYSTFQEQFPLSEFSKSAVIFYQDKLGTDLLTVLYDNLPTTNNKEKSLTVASIDEYIQRLEMSSFQQFYKKAFLAIQRYGSNPFTRYHIKLGNHSFNLISLLTIYGAVIGKKEEEENSQNNITNSSFTIVNVITIAVSKGAHVWFVNKEGESLLYLLHRLLCAYKKKKKNQYFNQLKKILIAIFRGMNLFFKTFSDRTSLEQINMQRSYLQEALKVTLHGKHRETIMGNFLHWCIIMNQKELLECYFAHAPLQAFALQNRNKEFPHQIIKNTKKNTIYSTLKKKKKKAEKEYEKSTKNLSFKSRWEKWRESIR